MTQPRWLNDREDRAWRGYRRMRTLLDLEIARDLARDSELSEPDYDVLSTLSEASEHCWRATELANRLLWSTSRLAHHVGRMQGRGLVDRTEHAEDGRGAVVALTDVGWAALEAAAPLHVESVRRHLIDLLTPAEIRALSAISGKVIDHLTQNIPQEPAHHNDRKRA